ncbi:MAG: TetR/AcrR family transcriptional regulator [Chitinispirillia bacterium]|jgi:AcrR family transcriptional regulator
MTRTSGKETKEKILNIAEELFSEKGFDATSVDLIAQKAGINKALIYYHYKSKQDLLSSLFKRTLDDLFSIIGVSSNLSKTTADDNEMEQNAINIINYLSKKDKILSILVMESIKNKSKDNFSLFKCADIFINSELAVRIHENKKNQLKNIDRDEFYVHEFFTGFIPVVFFTIYKDKWAEYFQCDPKKLLKLFIKVFINSHMKNH